MAGCACPQCFGLREYLEARGMDTHGLPPAPGHGQGLKIVNPEASSMTDLNGAELARLQHMARKRQSGEAKTLPWENAA